MNLRALRLQVWEHGEAVSARLTIPLRIGGTLAVTATLTNAQVLAMMKRAGFQFSRAQIEHVGSLFGGIGKFLKKVAKSSVMKSVMKIGKAVVNNPLVKMVAPQISAALSAADMAAKLVNAARGKDPKKAAKAKLAIVAAKAQAEKENQTGTQLPLPSGVANRSPATQAAFRYLVTVNRAA